MRASKSCRSCRAAPALETAPAAASNLQVTFSVNKNPAVVGDPAQIIVTVVNNGQQVERQVALSVLLPAELTPIDAQIQPAGTFTRTGQELRFQAVLELPPNQKLTFTIPVNPNRAGDVRVLAQLTAAGLAAPIRAESPVMKILPAPL